MSWLVNPFMLGASIDAIGGEINYFVENGITYAVHTFKANDKFTVLRGAGAVDYLIVAGGGSGGCGNGTAYEAGGGGAGGVIVGSTTVSQQAYSFTVGAGGIPSGGLGQNGSNSSAFGFTAIGGGRGATGNTGTGGNGGSGGGGSHSATAAGTGTAGQGYAGETPPGTSRGGGGGGAAEPGGTDGVGSGGDGVLVSITGTPQYFGGGGAAYSAAAGILGTPGLGGGGFSTSTLNGAVGNGLPNTGGGGGGAYHSGGNGGSGGSGVVIVRYQVGEASPTYGLGGTTIRAYNDGTDRWMVHIFTTTGAATFKRMSGNKAVMRYISVGAGGQGGSTIGGGGGGGGVLLGATDGTEISFNVGDTVPIFVGTGGTGGPAGEGAGGDGGPTYITMRQNDVLNPNFEVDASNWSADTGFSIARSTALAWTGTASLLVTATTNTTGDLGAWQSTRQATTPGATYTYSFYARRGTGSRNARVKFRFFDAASGGNSILDVAPSYTTLSSGAWTRVSYSVVAPMGGTWVGINFDLSSGAVNDTVYVDGFLFENSATLNAYFDGSTATSGVYPFERHWWTGTANASVSSEGIYTFGGTGGNKGNTFTGGSGGGGGRNSGTASLGTSGQGFDGSPGAANDNVAGAGGGATAAGGASTLTAGGTGGAGRTSTILAGSATFGSGGGAGVRGGNTLGAGGTSAGSGGDGTTAATSGTANRGGGGGGAGYNGTFLAGGNGGSGIAVIRYRANDLIPAIYTPITSPMSNYYDFAHPVCYSPHSPSTNVQSLGWTATTNGTLVGSPTWLPDYGGVMVFNGTSQYMSVGTGTTNPASNGTATRTYMGWMVGNGTIFGSNASVAGQSHIYVTLSGTTLTFNATYYGGIANDGPNSFTVTPHPSGVNFISLIKTATATLWDLYFNGAVVATGLVRQSNASTNQALGSPYSGAYLPLTVGMYWSHQVVLTPAQILSDYNATKARYGH